MELTKYETEALKEAIEKHIQVIEEQSKQIAKLKHAGADQKREMKRDIEKKVNLLKGVLGKLGKA